MQRVAVLVSGASSLEKTQMTTRRVLQIFKYEEDGRPGGVLSTDSKRASRASVYTARVSGFLYPCRCLHVVCALQ